MKKNKNWSGFKSNETKNKGTFNKGTFLGANPPETKNKGTFSPSETYNKDSVVTYLGKDYKSLVDNNLGKQPDYSPNEWVLFQKFPAKTTAPSGSGVLASYGSTRNPAVIVTAGTYLVEVQGPPGSYMSGALSGHDVLIVGPQPAMGANANSPVHKYLIESKSGGTITFSNSPALMIVTPVNVDFKQDKQFNNNQFENGPYPSTVTSDKDKFNPVTDKEQYNKGQFNNPQYSNDTIVNTQQVNRGFTNGQVDKFGNNTYPQTANNTYPQTAVATDKVIYPNKPFYNSNRI